MEAMKDRVRWALDAFFRAIMDEEMVERDCAVRALEDAEDELAFAAQMMREEPMEDEEDDVDEHAKDKKLYIGHWNCAFVDMLAEVLAVWHETKEIPLLELPPVITGVEALETSQAHLFAVPIEVVASYVTAIMDVPSHSSDGGSILVRLTATLVQRFGGARGVLTLLGIRETVGSRTICPMTRAQCEAAFKQAHGGEQLTVGARAITKHCQRSADGWWGSIRGNDAAKNAMALTKLREIMDTSTWKNVHSLPQSQATFEIRNALGYGARWYVNDQSFRGFLEPPMEDGHENRWRH